MTMRPRFPVLFGLLWIGGCALALVFQTRLVLHLPFALSWLDGFILSCTVFGYHCTHPRWAYRWLAWMLGLLGGVCFFWLDRTTQFLALGPTLLWAMYYGLQRPGRAGLRRRPVAKPIVIALAWAWVTVWLPAEQWVWSLFAGRAAFVFALALAYDLTDVHHDQRHRLDTLARQLGTEHTYRLIDGALWMSVLCVAIGFFQQTIGQAAAVALWLSYVWTAFALRKIVSGRTPVGWQKAAIDGLMIGQTLMVWLVA